MQTPATPRHPSVHEALHVVGLCAFAVAQPLFDVLGGNATFFVAHDIGAAELVLFALLVVIVPPLVLVALLRIIAIVSNSLYRGLQVAVVGILAGLTAAPPLGRAIGAAGWQFGFLAIGGLVALAYVRGARFRSVLTWTAAAPVLFVLLFLFTSQARQIVLPAQAIIEEVDAGDVPVVLMLLDELSVGSLVDENGEIDGARFPNFARLSATSTWYRNATTNGDSTQLAVSGLLAGQLADREKVPDAASYPRNLFTLMAGSHEINASEYVTRMCPEEVCGQSSESRGGFSLLFKDATVVYLHVALPSTLAASTLPSLDGRWADFRVDAEDAEERAPGTDAQAMAEGPETDEERALPAGTEGSLIGFERVVSSIAGDHDRTFWFTHVGIPHRPWQYLPSGQLYTSDPSTDAPGLGEDKVWTDSELIPQALQRYLLQLQYGDRLVGQLLDRLEEVGVFDDALVIVVADHGVNFQPDEPVRSLREDNAGQVIAVPLFVKYPGQDEGRVDDRNVQHFDIVPTIADVLGVAIPWETPGLSLLDEGQRPSEKHALANRGGEYTFGPRVDGTHEVSEYIREVFGAPSSTDDLYGFGPHRALVGKTVAGVVVNQGGGSVVPDEPLAYRDVDPRFTFLPSRFTAQLEGLTNPSSHVAVALNGVFAGVAIPYRESGQLRVSVMLSPERFLEGDNTVEVFEVISDGRVIRLDLNDTRYEVRMAGDRVVAIVLGDRELAVGRSGFRGSARAAETAEGFQLRGWAARPEDSETPETFVIVEGSRVVEIVAPDDRQGTVRRFDDPDLLRSGFKVLMSDQSISDVDALEVYAIFDAGAFPLSPRIARSSLQR